ncbi:hypothetical protein PY479_02075 [Shewanella sp. A32]|uniref:hypothetical protein n=1 Tax=Shewanella sp. A32 TaxID=3031327 RepID=UPI0023B975AA|nr:hypothetical protein [Shewanella sp. A32]MDF0533063.1 hypothetical protein [Shewanella sp. A32]
MDSKKIYEELHPSFRDLFNGENGQVIWECLLKPENKIRAETAAYLGKSPLDALTPEFLALSPFSDDKESDEKDRLKQLTGSLVRILMASWGYKPNLSKQRLPSSTESKRQLFKTATTYSRNEEKE